MNRIDLVKDLEINYNKYMNILKTKGDKEFSSMIYNGYRIKTTYKEDLVSKYNMLKMVNIDSDTKDIKVFNEGLKKIIGGIE